MNFTEAVKLAREGKEEGFRYLYDATYRSKFYLALQYMKNEDAAQDVVQNSYIKAFSKLNMLDQPEAFSSWLGRIVANTAKNELAKKNPMLFSSMRAEDQEEEFENLIEDEQIDSQPELSYTRQETQELVHEMIDSLSDEQRICILMFHIEENSIKDIAETLGCSENTVKSRLNYGRKNLKLKAEELQKKGYKLYGLSPVILLILLLQKEENIMAAEGYFISSGAVSEAEIFQYVHQNVSAAGSGAASSTAGTSAAVSGSGTAGFLSTTAGKILLTIGIGVLLGGGIGAATLKMHYDSMKNESAQEAVSESEMQSEESKEQKTADESTEPVQEETQEPTGTPEPENVMADAMEQYRIITSQAESYDYSGTDGLPIGESNGVYRYALVMMHPSDPVPTLLLSRENTQMIHYIRLFQYDPQTKSMIQPPNILIEKNTVIGMEADGNGIQDTLISGGTGDTEIYRVTLDGNIFSQETQWTGRMDQIPADLKNPIEITWYDISDTAALDQQIITSTNSETAAPAAKTAPVPSESAASVPQEDGNRIVFSGTVNRYSYNDVLSLQEISDPNPQSDHSNESFLLIVLDQPQTMELMSGSGDGYRSGEVRLVRVDDAAGMNQYTGQHLTFSIDPASTYWPSDTSLPIGEPSSYDVHVLG